MVDGSTLSYVFAYEDNLALFRDLADLCSAVIWDEFKFCQD